MFQESNFPSLLKSPLGLIFPVSDFEALSISHLTTQHTTLLTSSLDGLDTLQHFPIPGLNSYSRLIVGNGEGVGCGQEVVRLLHSFL